jgi:hypothetical protein
LGIAPHTCLFLLYSRSALGANEGKAAHKSEEQEGGSQEKVKEYLKKPVKAGYVTRLFLSMKS